MKSYDWIVVGGGITGAALSYELAKVGFRVLLLEQDATPQNATQYSYGGVGYWSGNTPLTRQLYTEAIARYQILSQELDADIEFRELDLLLTIPPTSDPNTIAASYANVAIPPRLLSVQDACLLEPLLNPQAISGALTVKHGHVHPQKTAQAYIQAFLRIGGQIEIAKVLKVIPSLADGSNSTSVKTDTSTFHAEQIAICAGGLSRQLLQSSGIPLKIYFTHAEVIETPPVDVRLSTIVMSAYLQRLQLETASTQVDDVWNDTENEPAPPILDAGAIQFLDGSLRLGQISRALTDPHAKVNPQASEELLRASVAQVLPALENLPGTWHHCLVAFSRDRLPLIGAIPGFAGVHIFSGFSSPFMILPPLAQRFARFLVSQEDEIITQLSPNRIV